MEINIKKFDTRVDINEISQFSYEVQKMTGYLEDDTTLDSVKEELEEARDNYKIILFSAYENTKLIGILLLLTNTPKFGLIWDWHPFVLPNINGDKIAKDMIKKCIDFAKENGINRIEVCFTIQKYKDKERYLNYFELYKTLEFYHVMEEAEMNLNLSEEKIEKAKIPDNFMIESIKDVQLKKLYACAYEIMNSSKDRMFLDLTEEQKWDVIKNYFNPSKPIIHEASFILTESNKIIGYAIAKFSTFEKNEVTISSFGIIPNFRKRGLGEALLLYSLKRLSDNNFNIINLDVAVENEPAYKLYLKVGFKIKFSTKILAYNC
ncbi:MAG: GNAT family N-acetyltransferase [Candidatus Hodarchaeota archaeon]